MASRAERTYAGEWLWTVDRVTLVAIGVLMVAGLVFLMGGGPPVAERLGLPDFHFVNRQIFYLIPSIFILIGVSMLPPRYVRRLALLTYAGGMVLILLALYMGPEVKGSRRWFMLGRLTLQPSEFVKPAFVVLTAWLLPRAIAARTCPAPGLRC